MSDPNDFEVTLNAFAEQAKEAWSERSTEERTTFENEISSSGSATAAKPIEPPVNDDLLKRMQERAALSGGFAPRALLAGLPVDDPNPLLDALAAESDRTLVGGQWHWTLRARRRESVLAGLTRSGRLAEALADAAKVTTDSVGQQLRQVLGELAQAGGVDLERTAVVDPSDAEPRLGDKRSAALQGLVQALSWAQPAGVGDDTLYRARQRAGLAGRISEFDRLLANGFVGRVDELHRVRTFIEQSEPTDGFIPLLSVVGIGGSGKSTLLAQLLKPLLENWHEQSSAPIVVAIDFDRLLFRVGAEFELSFEVTRQLGLAIPAAAAEFHRERERAREARTSRGEDFPSSAGGLEATIRTYSDFEFRASEIVQRHGLDRRKVVLVLDTFEEWQRDSLAEQRANSPAGRIGEWLTGLKSKMGLQQLRVLVGGRAPFGIPQSLVRLVEPPVELGDLTPTEAEELLHRLGVQPDMVPVLARVAGGNPLVLQLAARQVLALPPSQQATFLADAESGMATLDASLRQGFLYSRFLNHIADEQVRKLAHPGLALRRVTRELVRCVLAHACGLGTIDDAAAGVLTDKLGNEVWLVDRVSDELRHRSDVRRSMLKMMQSDPVQTDRVRAIHRAAAAWYAGDRDEKLRGEEAKVEALYHQLAGREPDFDLPEAWLDRESSSAERQIFLKQVGQLGSAVQDFPPRIAAQVAFAQGETITEETWLYLPRKHQVRWLEERGTSLLHDGYAAHALALHETYAAGRAIVEEPRWLAQAYFETARWDEYRPGTRTDSGQSQKYQFLNAVFSGNVDDVAATGERIYRSLRRQAGDKSSHAVDAITTQQDFFVLWLLRAHGYDNAEAKDAMRRLVGALHIFVDSLLVLSNQVASTQRAQQGFQPSLSPADQGRRQLFWAKNSKEGAIWLLSKPDLIGVFRPDPQWLRALAKALQLPKTRRIYEIATGLDWLRGVRSKRLPNSMSQLVAHNKSVNILDTWAIDFASAVQPSARGFSRNKNSCEAAYLLRGDNPELRPMVREALADAFPGSADFRVLAEIADSVLPVTPSDFEIETFVLDSIRHPLQQRIKLVEYVDRSGVLRAFLQAACAARPASKRLRRVTQVVVQWDDAFCDLIEDAMASRKVGRTARAPIAGLEGTRVRASSPFSVDDLERRAGHAADFLGEDLLLPLPKMLDSAEETSNHVWLHYTHFSVLMDRKRRQPRLSLVDIDGKLWRQITRAKDDVWYPDPRLEENEQPVKDFFQKPDPKFNKKKNDFAFGHMVRRTDPNWEEEREDGIAARAEQETFHLTNASPQAESLNSKTWNKLESIVLDDLKKSLKIHAVVLTGPELTGPELIHGTFPIPRQYWKIVAWRADNDLAAVGWRQRQPDDVLPATLELQQMPFDHPSGQAWLIPIREISAMSGLDLSAYIAADTYQLRRPQESSDAGGDEPVPMPANAAQLLMTDALAPDDALPGLWVCRTTLSARCARLCPYAKPLSHWMRRAGLLLNTSVRRKTSGSRCRRRRTISSCGTKQVVWRTITRSSKSDPSGPKVNRASRSVSATTLVTSRATSSSATGYSCRRWSATT